MWWWVYVILVCAMCDIVASHAAFFTGMNHIGASLPSIFHIWSSALYLLFLLEIWYFHLLKCFDLIMSTVLLIVLGIICVAEYHTHPPPTHKKIISPVPCPLNETSVQYFCCCFRFSFEDRCFIDFGFVLAPSWLPNRHFLASICGFTKSIEENPHQCCNDAAGMLRTDRKGRFGGGSAPC